MDQIIDQRIERSIEVTAPVSRVWRALTDHREFGAWFRARIDAPFRAGEASRGQITVPGFEHVAELPLPAHLRHPPVQIYRVAPPESAG